MMVEQEISGVKESIATIQDEMVRSDYMGNLVEDSVAQELGPSEIDTIKSEIYNLTRRLDKYDSESCDDC
jgi:hypothetical protein